MSDSTTTTPHKWCFFRTGGLDQVLFRTGADLVHLDQLDQKLWVALSCPTKGLEFDALTLELIDTDKDGRIRAPEFIAAIQWAASHLDDYDCLVHPEKGLPIAAIKEQAPNGAKLREAARAILKNLGKPGAEALTIGDIEQPQSIFASTRYNGDGIIHADSADDEETAAVISDIIATFGSLTDRSGKPGIDASKAGLFFTALHDYSAWVAQGEKTADTSQRALGSITPTEYQTFLAVKDKIDDYFARCQMAAFDTRSSPHLNRSDSTYSDFADQNLAELPAALADMPLASIEADKPLLLEKNLNPAWVKRISAFNAQIVTTLYPSSAGVLDATTWVAIKQKFALYESWMNSKKGAQVEKLGIERIQTLLNGTAKAEIDRLLALDLAKSDEVAAIDTIARLVRLQQNLLKLANNFVSFTDFYSRDRLAIFQAGTLFLDSRSCELCVVVGDPNAHATLATLSRCYIAYCVCKRAGEEPIKIAAIFSDGDSDDLMVGRNGIFYDRKGRDWDATIIRIIDNPISIRQAFWAPYKKFVRFIDDQVTKRATAAQEATTQKLSAAATSAAHTDPASSAGPKKIDVGTVAALGVALGSLGTFLTLIIIRIIDLGPWLPLAFVGLILLISCPSMFLAWIKLRQRTLGTILDATGWAINGRILINLPLAKSLTDVRILPKGSSRSLDDPFLDKEAKRRNILLGILFVTILVFLSWQYNFKRWPFSPEATDADRVELVVTPE